MHTPPPKSLALRTSRITYPGTAEHIRAVRADLRRLLDDCPMADDIILCASELATNAAIHSHSCLPGRTFAVRAEISSGQYVRIEVEDGGGPWTPAPSGAAHHHGLDIVAALANDWGINGGQAGRLIWAHFAWPG
jgi:serine/threonine-protein kinase RsbW